MAIKITIFSSYQFQQNNNFGQEIPYILYIYSTDYSAVRLPSHSVFQAIPKLYIFYSTVFKRGNSPKSVNVFKKTKQQQQQQQQ